jgi:hypothetical protein
MKTPFRLAFLGLLNLALLGCTSQSTPPTTTTAVTKTEPSTEEDSGHDSNNKKTAHLGKYHAQLTARMSSKSGNELEIFVETLGSPATPVALPLTKITGTARRDGDEKPMELTFEPAPSSVRPKDEKPGACSHFVAKAPWMKSTDTLEVVVQVELDGRLRKSTWRNFEVKNFTHHTD